MNPTVALFKCLRLCSVLPIIASLSLMLFAASLPAAETVLLDDSFTDLDHTVQSLPARSQWFYAGAPAAAQRLGTSKHILGRWMELKGFGQATMINGYFTPSGSPKQLAVGDSIQLSMSVTMNETRNNDNGFRVGLYNSSAENRRTNKDEPQASVGDNWTFGAYSGYGIYFTPVNPTPSPTVVFEIRKNTGTGNPRTVVPTVTAGSAGCVLLNSSDNTRAPLGITPNVAFPISIKITRTSTSAVEINVNVNGTTATASDSAADFTTAFDDICVFLNAALMPATTTIKFANVLVTYTPSGGAAQTLVNDSFVDGDRTTQSLPNSLAWFMRIQSTSAVPANLLYVPAVPATNDLRLSPAATANTAVSYFSATPQTLADGDALIVRASLRANGLASLARGIRFGLFNSAGSRATSDYEDGVTPVPAGLFGGYRGYSIDFASNGTAAGGMQVFKRNSAGSTPALFAADAFTPLGADTVGATALSTTAWSRVNFRVVRNGAALRIGALINDTWVLVTDSAPDTLAFDTLAIQIDAGGATADASLSIDDVFVVHSTGESQNATSSATIISENFNTGAGWSGLTFLGSAALGSITGNATREAAGTYDGFGSVAASGAVRLSANPSGASGAWWAALRSGAIANTNTLADLSLLTLAFDMRASNTAPVLVTLESLDAGGVATGRLERWIYPAAADCHQRFAFELSDMTLASGAFDATAPGLQLSWRVEGGGMPAFAWPGATAITVDIDNVHLARPRYYVSPEGSDSNAGTTAAAPFLTVGKAASLVEPGDIVLIRAGSGAAPHYMLSTNPSDMGIQVTRGGKPAAWVTFKAYPGETPVIKNAGWCVFRIGAGSSTARDRAVSVSHVEIRGLTLNGIADTIEESLKGELNGSANTNGVCVEGRYMANHPHHIRVADCVIQHCGGGGIATMQSDYITAENNLVRDNCFWSRYGPSGISLLQGYNFSGLPNKTRHFIIGNHAIKNQSLKLWAERGILSDGNGIIIDNFMNNQADYTEGPYIGRTLVQANVVALNGGSGMHAYQSRRVDVVNNSSWHNSQVLDYGEIWSNQSDDVRFYNNILVSPPTVSGAAKPINPLITNATYPIVVGVTYHNNLYQVGAGSAAAQTRAGDTDNITAAPTAQIYVDPAAGDFRLRAGSPAFDIGQSNAVTSRIDIAGMPRATDGVIDAGAFERQPVILRSPASANAVPGETLSLSVEAIGDSLTYAWTHNGTSLGGATLSTLAIPSFSAALSGTYVAVVSTPFDSVESAPAILSMADNPPPPEPDPSAPGVTGGGAGVSTVVNTAAELKTLAESASPAVIMVQGVIDLTSEGGSITVASGKTIQGLNASSAITGAIVIPATSQNIILRGLTITNPAAGGNGLYINGGKDVLVTHCTFHDCAENLALITKTTGNVTVSWSRFHYASGFTGARSAMKIGVPAQEAQPIGVTLHHNYWGENILVNMPVITHGRVHMYDNYFEPAGNSYGTIASDQTELFAEGNIYEQTANPLLAENVDTTLPRGLARVIGNAYNATPAGGLAPDTGTGAVFVPAYGYTLRVPTSIALLIPGYAGNNAGATSVTPPASAGAIAISGPDETLTPYTSFTLTSSVSGGASPVSYQWRKDNFPIEGATASTYTGTSIIGATHSGTYVLTAVLASGDTLVSAPKGIAVAPVEPPVITTQPAGLSKISNESANFTVVADSTEPPTYKWYKDGIELTGQTRPSLTLVNLQPVNSGQYTVEVRNSAGYVTSDAATLTVNMQPVPPPQGGTGNQNGGGAPSLWFLGALALLGAARFLRRAGARIFPFVCALAITAVFGASDTSAQAVRGIDTTGASEPAPRVTASATTSATDADFVVMSPFEVRASADTGYTATETLAGNRLNTNIRDLGNAVSIINSQFLQDIGATNAEELLTYTTNSEVSSIRGNFAGFGDGALLREDTSSASNRVRGLANADNTRDFFRTNIPWETYNTDGIDLQRGPNSILFGQGSPAGIINTRLKQALFKTATEVSFRVSDQGGVRTTIDTNQVLMRRQLAVRVIGLSNQEEYEQEPAFVHDRRLYAALRYEPRFLRIGSARTIIKVNFEGGKVDANRPHILPPNDAITPWFMDGTSNGRRTTGVLSSFPNLNKATYVPAQVSDNSTGIAGTGQTFQQLNVDNVVTPNPYFNPWVGGIGKVGGDTGLFDFIGDGGSSGYVTRVQMQGRGGLRTDGTIGNSIGGNPSSVSMAGIRLYSDYAIAAGLPLSEFGQYKNKVLTDPSIFNFYKQMLEGDNKREKSKFNAFNVNIAQTFFHDHLGLEAAYNRENVRDQRTVFLNYDRYTLYVDINSVYTDGTPDGIPLNGFADGTPNPNVGRPYTVDDGKSGSSINWTDREAMRLTGFARYDFGARHKGWWARVLGRQTITGLLARDTVETDRRAYAQWGNFDPNYIANQMIPGDVYFTGAERSYNVVTYLGGSIASRTSASGANIPGMSSQIVGPHGIVQARVFNSNWNAPGVDPNAPWTNTRFPVGHPSRNAKQNANPANYVGWSTVPVQIVRADEGYRDQLTTQANLRKIQTDSQALVWQGNFWDNTVIMTGGIRRDHARRWEKPLSLSGVSFIDLSPENYRLPDSVSTGGDMTATSKSGMIVVHLTNFINPNLPVSLSGFYNRSNSFQPESGRVDVYGEAIPLPSANTTDYGILLETRNRKFSLRVTRYETKAKNVSSSGLSGAYYLGASFADGQNYTNRYEYNWNGFTINDAVAAPSATNGSYNYLRDVGEDQADAQAREQAAIAGWRAWEAQVDPRFLKAWGLNLDNPLIGVDRVRSVTPVGFTLTEDNVSKGYEIEFTAQPLPNWRITINASKTDASRSNIGGANLRDFTAAYENALKTTKAGDIRLYYGDATQPTTRVQWNKEVGSEWNLRGLQDGSRIAELREWRANMITTYNFRRGFLKGFRVGGGVRWQDEVAIGYRAYGLDKDGNVVDPTVEIPLTATFDTAHPYMGPSETNIDVWVGYNRKLFKGKITWDIQLNVRDVGKKDGLIPINTQLDGTPAAYRIRYGQSFSLSSSFKF